MKRQGVADGLNGAYCWYTGMNWVGKQNSSPGNGHRLPKIEIRAGLHAKSTVLVLGCKATGIDIGTPDLRSKQ